MKKQYWIVILCLTGCSDVPQTLPSAASAQTTPTQSPDIFQHPVFLGIEKACLPYINLVSQSRNLPDAEALAAIENFTRSAGFRKGEFYKVHHRNSNNIYFIGDTGHGAELEAEHKNASPFHHRACSTSFGNIGDYPSLKEFTKWLNVKDPMWAFKADESADFGTHRSIHGTFCRSENTEFVEKLSYYVADKGHEPKSRNSMKITIKILEDRPCIIDRR